MTIGLGLGVSLSGVRSGGGSSDAGLFDADFLLQSYEIQGVTSDFSTAFSFSRTGNAEYVNSSNNIAAIGSGTPRIGHHVYNGSSWSEAGLLIETNAITNYANFSEQIENGFWVRDNLAGVNTNFDPAPDGTTSMDKLQQDGTFNPHLVYQNLQTLNGPWVFSTWIDPSNNTGMYVQLRPYGVGTNRAWATFNPQNGALTQSGGTDLLHTFSQDWGGGRYRVGIVASTNIANALDGISFCLSNNATGGEVPSYSGPVGTGASIWGAQFHQGTQPHFYFPSPSSSNTTRNSESLSIPAANLAYNASGLSGAFSRKLTYLDGGLSQQQTLFDWRVDASNRITVTLNTSGALTGRIDLTVVNGGSSITKSSTAQITDGFDVDCSVAWRVTPSEVNVALNGVAATASANTAGLPDVSAVDAVLGDFFVSSRERVWGSDIGDAGIAAASA